MHKTLWVLVALLYTTTLLAQVPVKQTNTSGQTWIGYVNQSRISKHWGLWVDGHLRTQSHMVQDLSQSIARAGLTYYAGETTWLTAGYAFVNDFPGDGHQYVSRPEHRPWQQVQWQTKYKHFSSMQRLRLEERYRRKVLNDSTLAKGYHFNFRVRYSLLFQVPLQAQRSRKSPVSLVINDEVMVNAGKQVVYNYFDQNRFFTGFNLPLNPQHTLQVGYMYIFQQLPAGNRYRQAHIARVYYYHTLDLRRKEKS